LKSASNIGGRGVKTGFKTLFSATAPPRPEGRHGNALVSVVTLAPIRLHKHWRRRRSGGRCSKVLAVPARSAFQDFGFLGPPISVTTAKQ
jgi:hypothetical protein